MEKVLLLIELWSLTCLIVCSISVFKDININALVSVSQLQLRTDERRAYK